MNDDKCPTCPKYGTGAHCDCGSSRAETSMLLVVFVTLILSAICCFLLIIFFG